MKAIIIILLLFASFNSTSQNKTVERMEREFFNSTSTMSISFHAVKSEFSVFFTQGLIVENVELDGCADIVSNKSEIEVILKVIKESHLFNTIYAEGENGIENLVTGELVDIDKNSLNIYLYFDSDIVVNPVYLGIENRKEAKLFISVLSEKLDADYCMSRLKKKL